MNKEELAANTQLNEYHVHDVNVNPSLSMVRDLGSSAFWRAECSKYTDFGYLLC
jgi:hypothetical protein